MWYNTQSPCPRPQAQGKLGAEAGERLQGAEAQGKLDDPVALASALADGMRRRRMRAPDAEVAAADARSRKLRSKLQAITTPVNGLVSTQVLTALNKSVVPPIMAAYHDGRP